MAESTKMFNKHALTPFENENTFSISNISAYSFNVANNDHKPACSAFCAHLLSKKFLQQTSKK